MSYTAPVYLYWFCTSWFENKPQSGCYLTSSRHSAKSAAYGEPTWRWAFIRMHWSNTFESYGVRRTCIDAVALVSRHRRSHGRYKFDDIQITEITPVQAAFYSKKRYIARRPLDIVHVLTCTPPPMTAGHRGRSLLTDVLGMVHFIKLGAIIAGTLHPVLAARLANAVHDVFGHTRHGIQPLGGLLSRPFRCCAAQTEEGEEVM